ncbi:MAG: alpha/beta fold hydrolase [Gammaproteobacteria bacterium]|nr:alpha/beta fold hydrolase [Gammaproteobacteria bacterium]
MDSRLIDVPGPDGVVSRIRVYQAGSGPDLLFQHSAGGLLPDDPFLTGLAEHFSVHAPLLPGYEDSEGGDHLRSMLDFTLHAFDVWKALGLERPLLAGHSMGGMIAAEMAAVAPDSVGRLVLICPAGLWRDDAPVTDLFAALPFELPGLLLHDPERHGHLLSSGGDFNDPEFLTEFMVGNARRLGTAGKLLFPIPDRGLASRLYRIDAATRIIWGKSDRMIDPVYASDFERLIRRAEATIIEEAGHMVPYEQTGRVVEIITELRDGP